MALDLLLHLEPSRAIQGDQVEVTVRISDEATGVAVDPPDVVVAVQDPTSAVTTWAYSAAQMTKVAAGEYQALLDTSFQAGDWLIEARITGPNAARKQRWLTVQASVAAGSASVIDGGSPSTVFGALLDGGSP